MPTIDVNARSKREAFRQVRKIEALSFDSIPDKAVPIKYRVTFHRRYRVKPAKTKKRKKRAK